MEKRYRNKIIIIVIRSCISLVVLLRQFYVLPH